MIHSFLYKISSNFIVPHYFEFCNGFSKVNIQIYFSVILEIFTFLWYNKMVFCKLYNLGEKK